MLSRTFDRDTCRHINEDLESHDLNSYASEGKKFDLVLSHRHLRSKEEGNIITTRCDCDIPFTTLIANQCVLILNDTRRGTYLDDRTVDDDREETASEGDRTTQSASSDE